MNEPLVPMVYTNIFQRCKGYKTSFSNVVPLEDTVQSVWSVGLWVYTWRVKKYTCITVPSTFSKLGIQSVGARRLYNLLGRRLQISAAKIVLLVPQNPPSQSDCVLDPDRNPDHPNIKRINRSLVRDTHLIKISCKSVFYFVTNPADRQTNKPAQSDTANLRPKYI